MPTFIKYLLIQIPEWVILGLFLWLVVRNTPVNFWHAVWFFAFWVIKDFILYPYVRRAYENTAKTGSEALIGGKGVARETIAPEGYIRIHGELWKARAEGQSIPRESAVRVTGARGLILFVEEEKRFRITAAPRGNCVISGRLGQSRRGLWRPPGAAPLEYQRAEPNH